VTLQAQSRYCHACSLFPEATKYGTSTQRGPDCYSGSLATAGVPSLNTIVARGSNKPARHATIFIHNGASQALVGCYGQPPLRRSGLFAGSPAREAFLRPAATVEREIGGVLFARSTRAVVLTYASLDFLIRIGYVISIGPYGLFQQGGTCGG
jgi:hypothetical protein